MLFSDNPPHNDQRREVKLSVVLATSVLASFFEFGSGGHSLSIANHVRRFCVADPLPRRQSTSAQLRDHKESTQRQYQLVHRLESLGWPSERIVVIDDDLGISGSGSQHRPGFQRLLTMVTQQKVAIVLGLEMSRLARNSKDWHDLFEVCAIYDVLIADEDAIFDTQDPNDRLVLGLKGIISEMELHTMKIRLERGRMMQQFFQLFETLGSATGLFKYLSRHNIRRPFRDAIGQIDWRIASKTTVYAMLKHPLYAGAFGYGRTKRYGGKRRDERQRKHLPPEQWKVLKKDCCPAYITWEQLAARAERNRLIGSERGSKPAEQDGGHCSDQYAASEHGSISCGLDGLGADSSIGSWRP